MSMHFDHYEVVTKLLAGSTGTLYRAFDPQIGRQVLLRVLPAGPYTVPELEHPCVRPVLSAFEIENQVVVVEPVLEGETLEQVLEGIDSVAMDRRVHWLECLADALCEAHDAGVVHGALSPEWITITPDGEPQLSGLGVAQLLEAYEPEPAADAFAFGVLAYELLTGREPFPGQTVAEALADEGREIPEPVEALVLDCPPGFAKAINLCLAGEASWQSVGLGSASAPPMAERPRTSDVGRDIVIVSSGRDAVISACDIVISGGDAYRSHRDIFIGQGTKKEPHLYDENVQLTVYRPRVVASGTWSRLLFFAHLDALPGDAAADEEDPIERVRVTAREVLGEQVGAFRRSVQDSLAALPHEGEVTVVPEMDGVQFNPPSVTFLWLESVHWHEFRLKASRSLSGTTARGRIVVRHGALLVGEVPVSLAVDRPDRVGAPEKIPTQRETGRAYRSVFPSYSHRDTGIVKQAEQWARALGDTYLRDVLALRSGERWNERLLELIEQADVFQLFWSNHSMRSPYVEQEWRHALALARPRFVRPTYWEEPLPEDQAAGLPPKELRALHFHFLGEVIEDAEEEELPPEDGALETTSIPSSLPMPTPSSRRRVLERRRILQRGPPSEASKPSTFEGTTFSVDSESLWYKNRSLIAAVSTVLTLGIGLITYQHLVLEPDPSPTHPAFLAQSPDGAEPVAQAFVSRSAEVVSFDPGDEERLLQLMSEFPEAELIVAGPAVGEEPTTVALLARSHQRAQRVAERLVELGIPRDRLRVITYPEHKGPCDESAGGCEELDERVEVLIQLPPMVDATETPKPEEFLPP